jgi:hypothetical protein
LVEPLAEQEFKSVTVTLYVPDIVVVAPLMEGEPEVELNDNGPVHEYP